MFFILTRNRVNQTELHFIAQRLTWNLCSVECVCITERTTEQTVLRFVVELSLNTAQYIWILIDSSTCVCRSDGAANLTSERFVFTFQMRKGKAINFRRLSSFLWLLNDFVSVTTETFSCTRLTMKIASAVRFNFWFIVVWWNIWPSNKF